MKASDILIPLRASESTRRGGSQLELEMKEKTRCQEDEGVATDPRNIQ